MKYPTILLPLALAGASACTMQSDATELANPAATFCVEQGGTYGVGPKIDAQMQPLLREIRGYPGLFLVGVYYKGKGAMYNFRVEAEVASHQIRQYLTHHPKPLYKGSAADTPTPG